MEKDQACRWCCQIVPRPCPSQVASRQCPNPKPKQTAKRRHHSVTAERIIDAVTRRMCTLDDPGFCVACGHEQSGCEPDMRRGMCEACGVPGVYGAEELLWRVKVRPRQKA
jgi:hypothetical protein